MKPDRHAGRRTSADASEHIGYLYDNLVHWLYRRQDVRRARPFQARLEHLLANANPAPESIFTQECWSLVHEAKGDLAKAIRHRENEVRLIRRLHEITRSTPGANYVLAQYSLVDLRDRLDLLAVLYHDNGQLDRALETLQESKRFCIQSAIPFDGADLLQEYSKESKLQGTRKRNQSPATQRSRARTRKKELRPL